MKLETRCLELALAAHRNGELAAHCARRPRVAVRMLNKYAHPLLWHMSAFDRVTLHEVIALWLRWGLREISPEPGTLGAIDRRAWLGVSAWRPFVALVAHYGFVAVPDFPERYRARRDEPAFERICGLWGIAPSSFYRYVERGKKQLAERLFAPLARDRFASLCDFVQTNARGATDADERNAAASQRLNLYRSRRFDDLVALWRFLSEKRTEEAIDQVSNRLASLCSYENIDTLLDRIDDTTQETSIGVKWLLLRARVAHSQNRAEVERQWLRRALETASRANDALSLARVYAATAREAELREVDRAMADYRESLSHFDRICSNAAATSPHIDSERIAVSIRLAWLYIQRNDPTAAHLVEHCEAQANDNNTDIDTLASLAQARAELSRRLGDRQTAINANLRALQFYERTANNSQALRVCGTLVLLYGESKDLVRAREYAQRVFEYERRGVEVHTVAATYLNLGVALFWSDRFDEAIDAYRNTLDLAVQHRLRPLAGRAHYNLAEAFYRRHRVANDIADEHFGDTHVEFALAIWEKAGDKVASEATRNLKGTVLGLREHLVYDRLLPAELAAHFDELTRIQSQRLAIQRAISDEARALAHLAVAKEYLDIAVKERERALALLRDRSITVAIDRRLRELSDAFHRSLSLEESIIERWRSGSKGVVPEEKLDRLAKHLARSDTIKKSTYASLCAVSPATASKHLALLAQSGLLVKANRGRATLFRRVDPS
jgi:tetratricopeptide (TPR) repeat protein